MKLNWYFDSTIYYGVYFDTFDEYFKEVVKLKDDLGPANNNVWVCDTDRLAIGFKNISTLCNRAKVKTISILSCLKEERLEKRQEIIKWVKATFPDGGCIFSKDFESIMTLGFFVFDNELAETMIRLRWSEEIL